ncbi:MAG: hypothetical protein C6H99_03860 [Epsilonproteobacteria bacterium]|nr:hypothetical protein [Campylobacterota bacterium]NPA64944.1 VWA domain-containing protein [Campylobacterota bacterium]
MSFLYPQILWFLIPLALFAFQKSTISHLPFHPSIILASARSKRAMHLLIAALILIALARPVIQKSVDTTYDAQPLYIALDLSASMRAQDLTPDRLTKAKETIHALIDQAQRRIGLIAFSANPLIIAPPTYDKTVLHQALDAIEPRYILTKSTNIQKVLDFASRFGPSVDLAIFSDGGEEQDLLKPSNITLFSVATATPSGALIPKDGGYLTHEGHLVVSRLNPAFLALADQALQIHEAAKILDSRPHQTQKEQQTTYIELFVAPLFLAALLYLLVHTSLLERLKKFWPLLLILQLHASIIEEISIQRAYDLYMAKEYDKSAQIFAKLPYQEARFGLARSLMKMGKYKEALKILSSIKSKDPRKKGIIYLNQGICYQKMGRFDQAKMSFAKAAQLKEPKALGRLKTIIFEKNQKKQPLPFSRQKKITTKKIKGDNKKGGASSNLQSALLAGNAKGGKKSRQKGVTKGQGMPLSSKVYEIINKGYIHEKRPW